MRLLVVCPTYYGYSQAMGSSLESLGHEVTVLDYFPHQTPVQKVTNRLVHEVCPRVGISGLAEARIARFNQKALIVARSVRPDLVLVVKGEILEPGTVQALSNLCATVLWAPDDPYRFENIISALPHYSTVASFSRRDADKLCARGLSAFWLPNGYAENLFHGSTMLPGSERRDASFVGARYPEREVILTYLAQEISLGIWGGDWKRRPWRSRFYERRTAVDGAAMGWADLALSAAIYRSCPVNLNMHGEEWDGLNTRLFEIPGAGGFQICDKREGVEGFFLPGKEIVVYRDREELLEMAHYYIKHESSRERIRAAGARRARREHGLTMRLGVLLGRCC